MKNEDYLRLLAEIQDGLVEPLDNNVKKFWKQVLFGVKYYKMYIPAETDYKLRNSIENKFIDAKIIKTYYKYGPNNIYLAELMIESDRVEAKLYRTKDMRKIKNALKEISLKNNFNFIYTKHRKIIEYNRDILHSKESVIFNKDL